MIDDFISMLVLGNKVETSETQIEACAAFLRGLFGNEDSRYELQKSSLGGDLQSSVNLVLSPDGSFKTLFEIEDEFAEIWYVANGLYDFQTCQIYRWREAIVIRFITTICTNSAVTGSIFLVGKQCETLMNDYEAHFHKLDSWNGSKSSERFLQIGSSRTKISG